MKRIRFILLLSISLLLWACQSASTGIPDKSASKISVSGNPNAAIDCKTGRALTSPAPAEVGLGAASLEHRGDQAVVTFTFPRTSDLAQAFAAANTPYFGSVGFIDPNLSLPPVNPTWYFDSAQNRGYKWFYNPGPHRLEGFSTYFKDNKWTQADESSATVSASGSDLIVTFPWSDVAGSVWYVSVTNPALCTSLGLSSDGKPNLPVPEGSTSAGSPIITTPPTPTLSSVPSPIAPTPLPAPTFEEPGY